MWSSINKTYGFGVAGGGENDVIPFPSLICTLCRSSGCNVRNRCQMNCVFLMIVNLQRINELFILSSR